MKELLDSLSGAGPYISVFICMAGALTWAMKDRTRVLAALDKSNERLLEEREKRTQESLETAKLLSDTSQKVAEHTKVLDKVLDRWSLSSPA